MRCIRAWCLLMVSSSGLGQAVPPVSASTAACRYSSPGRRRFRARTQTQGPITTLKVVTRVVAISAVVKSKDGEPTAGLTKDDFVLKQDDKEVPIRYFSQGSDLPLTIALMVDTSGSQRTFIGDEALASDVFFETMLGRKEDRAMLVDFDTSVRQLQGLTNSSSALHLALSGLSPRAATVGGTLLYDAVYVIAKNILAKEKGRKAMVILTDGGDNGSRTSLVEAIEQAQRADVQIYSILYSAWEGFGGTGSSGTCWASRGAALILDWKPAGEIFGEYGRTRIYGIAHSGPARYFRADRRGPAIAVRAWLHSARRHAAQQLSQAGTEVEGQEAHGAGAEGVLCAAVARAFFARSYNIDMEPLVIAGKAFQSRLIVGTGKYKDGRETQAAIEASGAEMVTVAVRRVNLDRSKESLLDFIDPQRYFLLPNTAGCYTADEAIRAARLGREVGLSDWVKIEVIGDQATLYPDIQATLEATRVLVKEGFTVLPYTSDDIVFARRLIDVGAAAVMPLGAPIGSGLGIQNTANLQILRERITEVPLIIDAGVGTASDAAIAMELGADAVLMNTGIAAAQKPVLMAEAMCHAVLAGRQAYVAGRMPRKLYATASSPLEGISK